MSTRLGVVGYKPNGEPIIELIEDKEIPEEIYDEADQVDYYNCEEYD